MHVTFIDEKNIRIENLTIEDFQILVNAMELKIQYPDLDREEEIFNTLSKALKTIITP
jgi:hypothetical protein